jgi:hypothetical protein
MGSNKWFKGMKSPNPIGPPKVQFCPKGHDTFIVGRFSTGMCKVCKRAKNREWEVNKPIKKYYYSAKF